MNYKIIYDNIINNAKSQNRIKLKRDNPNYVYYENHHIIPKCLNGSDDKNNLILLTAREHFVCHKLLTYIFPKNRKLVCAYIKMVFNKNHKNILSSRDFLHAKNLLGRTPMSEESKQKSSKKQKGIKKIFYYIQKYGEIEGKIKYENIIQKEIIRKKKYKHSEEIKKRIGEKGIGRICSEDRKRKIGEANKIALLGKKQSKETIEKRIKSIGVVWNTGLKQAWIKKSNETKIIPINELNNYLIDGWNRGRGKLK